MSRPSGHSRGDHRACAHSRSRCQLARTVVSLPRTPLVAPAALSPPDCTESPLDASLRRAPDVKHQDPFHVRRANAAVSKARGAFHRPVSPPPLRANAEHHFEQVEPLVASHLAALSRSRRLATLAAGPPFGAHLGHGVSFRQPRRAAATLRRSLRPDYRHAFAAGLPPARPSPVSERQPHAADRLLPTERSTSTPTNTLRSGSNQRLATLTGVAIDLSASHQQARRIATHPGWLRPLRASASRFIPGQGPRRLSAPRPPGDVRTPRRIYPNLRLPRTPPVTDPCPTCLEPAAWRDLAEFGLRARAQNESVLLPALARGLR